MIELAQRAVQVEIDKHPSMRESILSEFDNMIAEIESGGKTEKCYAEFIQYLDNNIRSKNYCGK